MIVHFMKGFSEVHVIGELTPGMLLCSERKQIEMILLNFFQDNPLSLQLCQACSIERCRERIQIRRNRLVHNGTVSTYCTPLVQQGTIDDSFEHPEIA